MELILEKIWKRVVKKKLRKKTGKKLILPWSVKNEEKKLKKANVQNLQIGIPLLKTYKICVFNEYFMHFMYIFVHYSYINIYGFFLARILLVLKKITRLKNSSPKKILTKKSSPKNILIKKENISVIDLKASLGLSIGFQFIRVSQSQSET